ncbi:MAG: galactokinase, partial [Bullifex sp.]|nr:galactokinase [Bullifex sp.]
AVSELVLKGKGIVRVHGGGFAGTIQAYVPDELLDEYISKMDALFGEGAATVLAIRHLPATRLC